MRSVIQMRWQQRWQPEWVVVIETMEGRKPLTNKTALWFLNIQSDQGKIDLSNEVALGKKHNHPTRI